MDRDSIESQEGGFPVRCNEIRTFDIFTILRVAGPRSGLRFTTAHSR